ncbi:unnamed protein product [Clavelina lepadiformis]|uniref:Uncharacterized protein n=1 Tax=Clavelina lepadiformis TaxID=159417 RepID=A0ABP0FPD8_CLALP
MLQNKFRIYGNGHFEQHKGGIPKHNYTRRVEARLHSTSSLWRTRTLQLTSIFYYTKAYTFGQSLLNLCDTSTEQNSRYVNHQCQMLDVCISNYVTMCMVHFMTLLMLFFRDHSSCLISWYVTIIGNT